MSAADDAKNSRFSITTVPATAVRPDTLLPLILITPNVDEESQFPNMLITAAITEVYLLSEEHEAIFLKPLSNKTLEFALLLRSRNELGRVDAIVTLECNEHKHQQHILYWRDSKNKTPIMIRSLARESQSAFVDAALAYIANRLQLDPKKFSPMRNHYFVHNHAIFSPLCFRYTFR